MGESKERREIREREVGRKEKEKLGSRYLPVEDQRTMKNE